MRDPEVRRAERCGRCPHPSLKCSLCGLWLDLLRSGDRLRITELEAQIVSLGFAPIPHSGEVAQNPSPAENGTPTEG